MRKIFSNAQEWLEKNNSSISIGLVTNLRPYLDDANKLKGIRLKERYFSQAIVSEFIDQFRRMGLYVRVFENEDIFFREVIENKYPPTAKCIKFVYNLSEPGLGPGGMSLVSAFSRYYGLCCCNSDPHGSTIGRHKYHSYSILKSHGAIIPESWWYFGNGRWCNRAKPPLGTKIIIKSSYESCSIGIGSKSICEYNDDIRILDEICGDINQPLFVQTFIEGKEISVPVVVCNDSFSLGVVLNTTQESSNQELFTLTEEMVFSGKKLKKYDFRELDYQKSIQIEHYAVEGGELLGFKGFCRIDFKLANNGTPYIIDVGAVPVLYRGSSVQVAAEWAGVDLKALLGAMLWIAYMGG